MRSEKSEMDMVKPEYEDNKVEHMDMISYETQDYKPRMDMVKNISNDHKSKMSMVSNVSNPEKREMDMVSNESNESKAKMDMIPNPGQDYNPRMDMVKNKVEDEKKRPMKMVSNITDSSHNIEMNMVRLTDNKELVEKIYALTSLDTNEIRTADIDHLVSLADIIEDTIKEIKNHEMKMVENKPKEPKKPLIDMVKIEQPTYRQFILSPEHEMREVDLVAIERDEHARLVANEGKDSYSTKGERKIIY
jgi:hypothetical protein